MPEIRNEGGWNRQPHRKRRLQGCIQCRRIVYKVRNRHGHEFLVDHAGRASCLG